MPEYFLSWRRGELREIRQNLQSIQTNHLTSSQFGPNPAVRTPSHRHDAPAYRHIRISAVFKPLAIAVALGSALLPLGAGAYDYGDYASQTLDRLIHDYPGSYRGTASFAGAADWMQAQLGYGYQTSRQDFTWAGTRSSQNVIASAAGTSSNYVVLGAHFDTYFGRPTLQGLDLSLIHI